MNLSLLKRILKPLERKEDQNPEPLRSRILNLSRGLSDVERYMLSGGSLPSVNGRPFTLERTNESLRKPLPKKIGAPVIGYTISSGERTFEIRSVTGDVVVGGEIGEIFTAFSEGRINFLELEREVGHFEELVRQANLAITRTTLENLAPPAASARVKLGELLKS